MWHRLAEMLTRHPVGPVDDERSIQAKRLDRLARVVPAVAADLRTSRIRAEAILAQQRMQR